MKKLFVLWLVLMTACNPTPSVTRTSYSTATASVKTTDLTATPPESSGSYIKTTVPLEVVVWLKENVIPFKTSKPGNGFDDLVPLKEIIGDARIVALGEATHGTHEFFEMKHRLFEFLVKEMGFNTFAMEASWPEANLINDYVHTGEGEPGRLLAGLKFWTWNTQEVLDMIQWMRVYNQDSSHTRKVSFYGFDMQFPNVARDNIVAYLQKVDPAAVPRVNSDLKELFDYMESQQAKYEVLSSSAEFARALQSVRVALQYEEYASHPSEMIKIRDRSMAENVAWLLEQAGPDAKIVLWAHNGHVAVAQSYRSMGSYLRERYGKEMVVFGFTFYSGACNAVTQRPGGESGKLTTHQVPPPPPATYESYFHSAGIPRFFLDLRNVRSGAPATDWLQGPRYLRHISAVYNDCYPENSFWETQLPEVFDVIIYFESTSPSVSLVRLPDPDPVICPRQPENLDFEANGGWFKSGTRPDDYQWGIDYQVTRSGKPSGHIKFTASDVIGAGVLAQMFRADDYLGKRVRLSGYIKATGIDGQAEFQMRVGGINYKQLSFDKQPIQDTSGWKKYEIALDVPEDSVNISFGILLEGKGQVWVDDLRFEVVWKKVPTTDSLK